MLTHLDNGSRLRAMMDTGCVACPGAFNGLVGRAVAQAGFGACYVSGGAISAASGVPDVGLLDRGDFCRIIREVTAASGLPVLADADTGFGEEEQVRRTVIDYAQAGAAGLHIEDQVFPKRCGHLDGKALVPVEQMVSKVEWASKAARDFAGNEEDGAGTPRLTKSPIIVCARTDAAGVEGFEAAVERAKAYVEAGADMIFPEGLRTEEEFGRFAEAMRGVASTSRAWKQAVSARSGPLPAGRGLSDAPRTGPYLLANMTEFGKTPMIGLGRFAEMGYDLVIYPVSTLRLAMGSITRALEELKTAGTLEGRLGEMQSREELYGMLGYRPGEAWEMPGR